jgi:hypothetical protein
MFLKKCRTLLHHSVLKAERKSFAVENHESLPDDELGDVEGSEGEDELEEVEDSEAAEDVEEDELEEVDALEDAEVSDAPGLLLSLPEYASEYQPPPLR